MVTIPEVTSKTSKRDILQFMRSQSLAVQASVSPSGVPQAAVVGFVVTDTFEIIFDTTDATRKVHNLRNNPSISFVIGGMTAGDERTVQYEGTVDEPQGKELEYLREIYFAAFPEGRERLNWRGLIHMRVRPLWLRFCDFNQTPPEVVEFSFVEQTGAA